MVNGDSAGGELDDSGTKFNRDGRQSKVFVYDNRDECLVDMAHCVKNFILFNAGLPPEDGPPEGDGNPAEVENQMKKDELSAPAYISDVFLKDTEVVYVKDMKLFDRNMKQVGVLKKAATPPRSRNC